MLEYLVLPQLKTLGAFNVQVENLALRMELNAAQWAGSWAFSKLYSATSIDLCNEMTDELIKFDSPLQIELLAQRFIMNRIRINEVYIKTVPVVAEYILKHHRQELDYGEIYEYYYEDPDTRLPQAGDRLNALEPGRLASYGEELRKFRNHHIRVYNV